MQLLPFQMALNRTNAALCHSCIHARALMLDGVQLICTLRRPTVGTT
jgi:hypothetical protein